MKNIFCELLSALSVTAVKYYNTGKILQMLAVSQKMYILWIGVFIKIEQVKQLHCSAYIVDSDFSSVIL